MWTYRWQILLILVLVVGGLTFIARQARRRALGLCDLDGVRIEPLYRVRIVDQRGLSRDFCCIRCATLWLESRGETPRAIQVTDETSGQEVKSQEAYYVRSSVVTTATTGNRVHAFRVREDAERHAAAARGRLLTGADRPFASTGSAEK